MQQFTSFQEAFTFSQKINALKIKQLIMPTIKYSELWDIFSNISVLLDSAKSYCGIYKRYIQKRFSTSIGKKATCSYYNNGLCQRKFLTLFSELHKVP
jgi:hypothetical protein